MARIFKYFLPSMIPSHYHLTISNSVISNINFNSVTMPMNRSRAFDHVSRNSSRFRAPNGSDQKTAGNALWIQSDEITMATIALLSARSEAFIAQSSIAMRERTIEHLFSLSKKKKIKRFRASSSFGFPARPYRTWEIEWWTRITFLHISGAKAPTEIKRTRARDSRACETRVRYLAGDNNARSALMFCTLKTDTCLRKPLHSRTNIFLNIA